MKLTKICLSYTVECGESEQFETFKVNDFIYINSNSDMLKDLDRLEELKERLLDASVRGGGRSSAIYSDSSISVVERLDVKKHPNDMTKSRHSKEPTAFYIADIDPSSSGKSLHAGIAKYEESIRIDNIATPADVKREKHRIAVEASIVNGLRARYTPDVKIKQLTRDHTKTDKKLNKFIEKHGDVKHKVLLAMPQYKKLAREFDTTKKKLTEIQAKRSLRDSQIETFEKELRVITRLEAGILKRAESAVKPMPVQEKMVKKTNFEELQRLEKETRIKEAKENILNEANKNTLTTDTIREAEAKAKKTVKTVKKTKKNDLPTM